MKKIYKIFCMAIAIMSVFCTGSMAKKTKTIAIVPIQMNAKGDVSFIQRGILDILRFGLESDNRLKIIETAPIKSKITNKKALDLAKKIKSDYALTGICTVFGESINLGIKLLNVNKSKEILTLSDQSKNMNDLSSVVNGFVSKIKGAVFRQEPLAIKQPLEIQMTDEVKPRSEVSFKKVEQQKSAHVQAIKHGILSLDVADVDGNGSNELVMITGNQIKIYKWSNNNFELLKTIKGKRWSSYVHVNTADLNGNGRAEIYVSCLGESNNYSFVLEWNKNKFEEIAKDQPWFFRVMDLPGMGQQLIGQKRATSGSFFGKVYTLKKQGKEYISETHIKLPHLANVFNFAFVDFEGNGNNYLLIQNDTDYLFLFNKKNEQVWQSSEPFGGNLTYFIDEVNTTGDAGSEKYVYLASPMRITDINNDGHKEILVCKNNSLLARLTYIRNFKNGEVYFLTWNKAGLETTWKSEQISGAIVGYNIADVDNDGNNELIIASVISEKGLFKKAKSQIVVYEIK